MKIRALQAVPFLLAMAVAAAPPAAPPLLAPFRLGWMLRDTNSDGLADAIAGQIVVPDRPSADENAAAANWAARLGYATTALSLPIVVIASQAGAGPHVYIGRAAAPPARWRQVATLAAQLKPGEGGVFAAGNDLVVAGDAAGMLAAADDYSAHAPFQWKIPGPKLAAFPATTVGLVYRAGRAGIARVLVSGGVAPALPPTTPLPKPKPPDDTTAAAVSAGPARQLDLATLYTSHGLFKGPAKMPLPATLDAMLYVPSGPAGVAMANFAARMGLEATGIKLPLAAPAPPAALRDVATQAVIAGQNAVAVAALAADRRQDPLAARADPTLAPSEGQARVVDAAFPGHPPNGVVLLRGDAAGQAAALDLLADRFPNLWTPGKPYWSLADIRYDLHRFFSLRSGAGQAADALYHLDRWMHDQPAPRAVREIHAEVFVDLASPGLSDFVRRLVAGDWGYASAQVVAASLRAGTRCCTGDPGLHFSAPGFPFNQAQPTFAEELTIPWEGRRLLDSVAAVRRQIRRGQPAQLEARVSEGPAERQRLAAQLRTLLLTAGADPARTEVSVLCAYKQGYSWLMDEIAPALAGRPVAHIRIEFARDVDPSGVRTMFSPARWVQELYPVDEMLARRLHLPLANITLDEMPPTGLPPVRLAVPPTSQFRPPIPGTAYAGNPTYRVTAYDADGRVLLRRSFTETTAMRPYNGVMPRYEQVQVETGWVTLTTGGATILDIRIPTDIEEFWNHYQNVTLPRIDRLVMAQSHGDLRAEFQPPFDTLKLDIHMSEPDYNLGLDHERISSLEALQEDTFYSTVNFVEMMGDLEAGHPLDYTGRIVPVVHPSADGQDGHVRIEFYAKAAAHPLVRLWWVDAAGRYHQRERSLPALSGKLMPRLVGARVRADGNAIEDLTWALPADFADDDYAAWLKVEGQDQVDRTIFSATQAAGQLYWIERMHAAGLYRDALAYPHLDRMNFELVLPKPVHAAYAASVPDANVIVAASAHAATTPSAAAPAPRVWASLAIAPPAHPRPLIANYAPAAGTQFVPWDEPIGNRQNERILARLAQYPGVTVYWMGRSYLGINIWAADIMLPTPSKLRSWAKATTLKAAILYSGRQHANEVSSTSHLDRLAEMLVSDPSVRAELRQVNVVLHPIDNPDGTRLSMLLAQITPDNLLHPGYHGSLAADVSAGQSQTDPIYPESRTRKQLLDAWLPDAFLNPHGYPSHEWVQPFSEYTGWVENREGANPGRAWWIPRGWFTSLGYLADPAHPESEQIAYALRDRIVAAERAVPGLLPLEARMDARYERFGQRWQPRDMFQPIVGGIRIYMALKGAPPRPNGATGGVSPDITWDAGYTEAPDETAHGAYLHLLAAAGLAFDRVHLDYLARGRLEIHRTQRAAAGAVTFTLSRRRPISPPRAPSPRLPPASVAAGTAASR